MHTAWQRIFDHEIARRRRIRGDNPDLFKKMHMINPKGLVDSEHCPGHVFVPASTLMIHDGATRSVNLSGVKTRGFSEATPFTDDGFTIIPQMCWRCDATREREIPIQTFAERLAALQDARPVKPRKLRYTIESAFDDLFGDDSNELVLQAEPA